MFRGDYLLQLGVQLPQLAFSPPLFAASFFLPFSALVPVRFFGHKQLCCLMFKLFSKSHHIARLLRTAS